MADYNGVTIPQLPTKALATTDYFIITDTNGASGKALASDLMDQVAEQINDEIQDIQEVVDDIYSQFANKDEIGTYNASTNLATIRNTEGVDVTFTPTTVPTIANGKSLRVEVAGTQNITGASKDMLVGGGIISRGGVKWDYMAPADTGYSKVISLENVLNPDALDDRIVGSDSDGNVFFEATVDGVDWNGRADEVADLQEVKAKTSNFIINEDGEVTHCDPDGNVFFRSSPDGIDYPGKGSDTTNPNFPDPLLVSDFFQILIYGQSLSVSGSFASAIDFFDAKTFTGGILTNYDPDTAGAANAYFGSALISLPTTGTETPGKALSKIIKELIRDENGLAIADQGFTPVVNSCGTAGTGYSTLANVASDEYRRLVESVKRGKDFALGAGKTYNVPILAYIQGENSGDRNKSESVWAANLETLFNQLNTDIKTVTGQSNDVQFIVYQIASSMSSGTGVPLGFLKVAKEKTNVHFGCSMYDKEYTDALHVTSNSYRIMGAQMGVAAKRILVDGVKMEPIGILSKSIQKNEANTLWVIKCKMHVPVKPLVFDESVNSLFTTAPAYKGFVIKNGSNTDIVTNVTISHGDTVNIFCAENPAGLTLTYAIGGRDSGGNLRDSQGDKLTISCAGVNIRVDNWCPIFSIVI